MSEYLSITEARAISTGDAKELQPGYLLHPLALWKVTVLREGDAARKRLPSIVVEARDFKNSPKRGEVVRLRTSSGSLRDFLVEVAKPACANGKRLLVVFYVQAPKRKAAEGDEQFDYIAARDWTPDERATYLPDASESWA